MEFETRTINMQPLFKGEKYKLWKVKMIDFLKYMDEDMSVIIEEGISSLLSSYGEFWNEHEKNKYELNTKARHILMCALFKEKLSNVIALSVKEMWETISLSHRELKGDSNSSDSKIDHICFMEDTTENLTSKEFDEVIHDNTITNSFENFVVDNSSEEVNFLNLCFDGLLLLALCCFLTFDGDWNGGRLQKLR